MTNTADLVNFTVDMFESQCASSNNTKLMLILSDGVNTFSQGQLKTQHAVRRAKLANIFIVFIILDNVPGVNINNILRKLCYLLISGL